MDVYYKLYLFLIKSPLPDKENVEHIQPPVFLNSFSLMCSEIIIEEETETDTQIVIDELKKYRGIKLQLNDKSCPILFYKQFQHILPQLSEIASIVFCTTASSVPSECVFSSGGLLINKLRSRLSPAMAEDLLFLKLN